MSTNCRSTEGRRLVMISPEERESIIREAVERALLVLPETVGTLMANQAAISKITSNFYSKYPEFKTHKGVVASVIEGVEAKNPVEDYERILNKAVPEIRKRIKLLDSLDMKANKKPDLLIRGDLGAL